MGMFTPPIPNSFVHAHIGISVPINMPYSTKKHGNSDEKVWQSKKTHQWLATQMPYLRRTYVAIATPSVGFFFLKIDSFPLLSKKSPITSFCVDKETSVMILKHGPIWAKKGEDYNLKHSLVSSLNGLCTSPNNLRKWIYTSWASFLMPLIRIHIF
jgi:hypothetical protein